MQVTRLFKFLILIIIVISCNRTEVEQELPFASIDYSYFMGQFESIKIDNSGQILIWQRDPWTFKNKKYSFYIDLYKQDTLLDLIKHIHSVKLDSILEEPVADHPVSIGLIINYKDSLYSYSYLGDMNDTSYSIVYKLSNYLNNLSKRLVERTDSDFMFESTTRLILPPPPK